MEKRRRRMAGVVLACLVFAVMTVCGGDMRLEEVYTGSPWNKICVYLRFSPAQTVRFPQKGTLTFEPAVKNISYSRSSGKGILAVSGDFEPETVYRLSLKKGFSNDKGDELPEDIAVTFRTHRLERWLSWLTSGCILPLGRKNWSLPLGARNLDSIKIHVDKVYVNNLLYYDWDGYDFGRVSEMMLEKVVSVALPENKRQECQLDLTGLLPSDKPGMYLLKLEGKDTKHHGGDSTERKLVIVTDLGIASCYSSESGDLFVSVRRLSDSSAVSGAAVRVFSYHHQVLAEGKTNESGTVLLKCRLPENKQEIFKNMADAILVTAGEDSSVLKLEYGTECKAAENMVNGSKLQYGADAFVYAERGVARPGETIALSAFVMNREKGRLTAMESVPCVLTVTDSRGHDICKKKLMTGKGGFVKHCVELDAHCATGSYSATLLMDEGGKPVGKTMFLVTTYVPDNVKLTLGMNVEELAGDGEISATASAAYYFGAPADDLPLKTVFSFEPVRSMPKWGGYTVGDWASVDMWEKQTDEFDCIGEKKTVVLNRQAGKRLHGPLKVTCEATVTEKGGRATTRRAHAVLHSSDWYLGLNYSYKKPNVIAYRKIAAMNGKSAPAESAKATMGLIYNDWEFNLVRQPEGNYAYEWEQVSIPLPGDVVAVLDGEVGEIALPADLHNGYYEAVVSMDGGIQTRLSFWYCGGEGGRRTSDPKSLVFKTDKAVYRPGDVATLTLEANAAGHAAVAYGACRLEGGYAVDVKEGTNQLTVKIPEDILTSCYYCGVTLVAASGGENRQFALGVLNIDQTSRRLAVNLESPDIVHPQKTADIRVRLTDDEGKGVSGTVHVFLVDEGVLALTDFRTPDIFGYFCGARCCEMTFHDIYPLIFPDAMLKGAIRIGGDMNLKAMNSMRQGDLAAIKSALIVLDAVQTDRDGVATLTVTAPEHLGGMRIMCVAASDGRFGTGERRIIVRRNVDVLSSGPRMVTMGDEFTMTYVLNNFDCRTTDDYAFDVTLSEGAALVGQGHFEGKLPLGGRETVAVRVKVGERFSNLDVRHRLAMGTEVSEGRHRAVVRRLSLPVTESERVVLEPGASRELTLSLDEWLQGTVHRKVLIGAPSLAGCENCLNWLNSYPYGCLEQTTACAFPFLFMPQMRQCGLITDEEKNTYSGRLEEGVRKLMSMYRSDGRFAMWPDSTSINAHSRDASLFAAHYLLLLNQQMPQDEQLLFELAYMLANRAENGNERRVVRAYCCYLLSLRYQALKSRMSVVELMSKHLLASSENDLAAFLASAALVNCGFASFAMPRFKACLDAKVWYSPENLNAFSDEASRYGMILAIVMEMLPKDASTHELAAFLHEQLRSDGSGYGTTQANAWAVAGLAAYGAVHKGQENVGTVSLNGGSAVQLPKLTPWKCELTEKDTVRIVNNGKAPMLVNVETSGVRKGRMKSVRGVLSVQRSFLDKNGVPVHYARHGELLTVKLTLSTSLPVSGLVLVDMLPGGLEIEDGTLAARAAKIKKDNAEGLFRSTHQEVRDDRYLLFGDMEGKGAAVLMYQVRAVTRGTYQLTPTTVDAMYIPDLHAVSQQEGTFVIE